MADLHTVKFYLKYFITVVIFRLPLTRMMRLNIVTKPQFIGVMCPSYPYKQVTWAWVPKLAKLEHYYRHNY
jgi:hypothetical protein